MPVSKADRAYFARIGLAKQESHAAALQAHLALDLDERLERSWELYVQHRDTVPRQEEEVDATVALYELAKQRGLYWP